MPMKDALFIIKRDGRKRKFDETKIVQAILAAGQETGELDEKKALELADRVVEKIRDEVEKKEIKNPTVEQVQDVVENTLMASKYKKTAKAYILYREQRSKIRGAKSKLMEVYRNIAKASAKEDSDVKRGNANVNGDAAMGKMLQFGAEGSKEFALNFLVKPDFAKAHQHGDIHIHDLDFYATGTLTCCQTDPVTLFENGFNTGHGFLRTPQSIGSYAALAAIMLQANQNEQHGGQSIPNFDYAMAPGVNKTYRRAVKQNIAKFEAFAGKKVKVSEQDLAKLDFDHRLKGVPEAIFVEAAKDTEKQTQQAMEGLVHNLNTMHSRAGAQVPFTSLNFGTDTTPSGRLVIKHFLNATEAGLGKGETPIFPISIFKVKEGVNYNPEDPNYDLFKQAMKVSAQRLFPNFTFLDAPFNLKYYKKGDYLTETATMGCRTRVQSSVFPESDGRVTNRGNCSFTTINLPRIGIKHGIALGERTTADWKSFYQELDEKIDTCAAQILDRFEFQGKQRVYNFPFLMGQGNWIGSKKLRGDEELREVIKHGSLSIGFIGLAETLKSLVGEHHGESEETQKIGLEIIKHMRDHVDGLAKKHTLNFTLFATPAEGIAGRFTKIDKKEFGEIAGITDKEFYTNSFHVPVYQQISAFEKIEKEAPYHALCNAGHITYVELDGDLSNNITAFESVIRKMKESGVGYGSVNHPVDRDPVCGFSGVIDGVVCPSCGREEWSDGIGFERLRRITGYLVGSLERWNDAKKAEEKVRVKHGVALPINSKDEKEFLKVMQDRAVGKV